MLQASDNLFLQPQERNLLDQKWVALTTLKLLLFFHFSQLNLSALFWNWQNILKQNYVCSACNCSLLQTYFSVLCQHISRPWQIKFLVMNSYVLVFDIICSLTYFHSEIFVCFVQKIYYLDSPWTHTIFTVTSIRWLF